MEAATRTGVLVLTNRGYSDIPVQVRGYHGRNIQAQSAGLAPGGGAQDPRPVRQQADRLSPPSDRVARVSQSGGFVHHNLLSLQGPEVALPQPEPADLAPLPAGGPRQVAAALE